VAPNDLLPGSVASADSSIHTFRFHHPPPASLIESMDPELRITRLAYAAMRLDGS
jgi:hypothetical protein